MSAPRPSAGAGWTGGQYSLVRALLGLALAVHLARLVPHAGELFTSAGVLPNDGAASLLAGWADDPSTIRAVVAVGVVCALLVAAGLRDRWAALALWAVWTLAHGRNPLVADSGAPFVGWVLLFHAALPAAPFGSADARGRLDPRGTWAMPDALRGAAWIILALTTTYNGASKLASEAWVSGQAVGGLLAGPLSQGGWVGDLLLWLPGGALALGTWGVLGLQLGFAPLACIARLRPWLWTAMLGATVVVALAFDSPDASLGRLALLAVCFEPRWIRPAEVGVDRVFFDGACGLCHRAVRFAVAEELSGERLRFAPIDGEAFRASVPAELRIGLPDSILVVTHEGELLDRSRALGQIGRRLGGFWRLLAILAELIPLALRDSAYDLVASIRHRLFTTPDEVCPVLPADLRARFDP